MKRKITSLAVLVLSLLMAAPALAEQSLTQVGEVTTAPEAGKYYVIQGNGQANQITWLFDNDGALAATESEEAPIGPEAMKYVWTFEVTDNGYAAQNLVSGRYIHIAGTSNGGAVQMQASPSYFTIESDGDFVAFKNASDLYIDMSYSGTNPVTWGGGVAGSRRLNIYIATVESVDDLTIAKDRLNACFGKYSDYLPDYGSTPIDDMRGTEIGQYNFTDEDRNAFVENMQMALAILQDEVEDVTAEQMYAIIDAIETAYANIMASLVQLTIADGNYRIVSALTWNKTVSVDTGQVDENGDPITEDVVIHPTKAMYATLDEGKAMWADIDSTDCRYLWKMTNNPETGFIQMMNIATDGILASCSQSAQATLTKDSQTEMAFEFIERREDGKIVLVMKPSTGGSYAYLHCNNHGGGSGTASNIVGWASSAGASQWILEPVSDEEVAELIDAYAPIKDHELLVAMFQDLIAETEAAIAQAKDDQYITERSAGLIREASQYSSPFSETREGSSFANLFDDNTSTFWHSDWSSSVSNHTHFFNVALIEPVEGDIQCFMRRRNAANDHITLLGVFGSNNESALESATDDGWTELGSFDLSANASASQTVYSNAVNLAESYQYLRFYIDGTTTGRGYGHMSQFQLYKLTIDGNTQWSQMGDAATAIEEALETAKAVDPDDMTDMTDYDALKAALDAFKAILVDPSALAAAIAANKDVTSLVAIGENPGFWAPNNQAGILASTIQEATAYLKSGKYTQAEVDAYVEAITSGAADIFALANPVEEGKWYAFKFDSIENYEARGWNKADPANATLGDLFDNYAAPADVVTEGEGDEQSSRLQGFSSLEDIAVGQNVRFINEDVIEQMDQIAFRFIAQGDSAYVIQHKSGLYLNGASRSTNLSLGLSPALFNVKAVGYGKVVIEVRNLKGQGYYTAPVYLHAQNAGHSLVTWSDAAVSSKSALFIEPVSDFDEGDDVAESVLFNTKPNSIQFVCFPAAFSVADAEIYAYQGAFEAEKEPQDTTSVALANYAFNRIEQAAAGQPVLLVVGDREDFVADNEEEPAQVRITPLGTNFAVEPQTTGGVHGTFAYEWVDEGTVVVGGGGIAKPGNTLVLAKGVDGTDCTRDIAANTGYIVYGENIITNTDDFDLVITAERPLIGTTGDANNDGSVDIADVTYVLTIMASNGDAAEYPSADANGDGTVDIADVTYILTIMAAQ